MCPQDHRHDQKRRHPCQQRKGSKKLPDITKTVYPAFPGKAKFASRLAFQKRLFAIQGHQKRAFPFLGHRSRLPSFPTLIRLTGIKDQITVLTFRISPAPQDQLSQLHRLGSVLNVRRRIQRIQQYDTFSLHRIHRWFSLHHTISFLPSVSRLCKIQMRSVFILDQRIRRNRPEGIPRLDQLFLRLYLHCLDRHLLLDAYGKNRADHKTPEYKNTNTDYLPLHIYFSSPNTIPSTISLWKQENRNNGGSITRIQQTNCLADSKGVT